MSDPSASPWREQLARSPADNRTLTLTKHFWSDFLRSYRGRFAVVATLMVLTVLLQLPTPLLTMFIIDSAVEEGNLGIVTQLALLFAGLIVVRHVSAYLNEIITLRLKESIILDVAAYLTGHLQSLPVSFFTGKHSTYLQSRLMNDSRAIEGALVRTVVNLVTNSLTFLVGVVVVFFIRWQLGLFLLATLMPFAFIRYYANDRMRALSREMQERQAVTSAVIAESLAAVRTIKSFHRESFQQDVVTRRLQALKEIYVQTNWFGILSTIGTSLITTLAIAVVLWYGLREVIAGTMTVGEVVGVLSFLNFLYGPINIFVAANLSLQQSASALQRIYEFLIEKPEESRGVTLDSVRGEIVFENVSFGYEPNKQVIRTVNLAVRPGETIALVGRSGAGKSTLVNLLLRFYEPQSGRILLDGREVKQIALGSLREAIGLVDQETFLFSGSIRDNVRFGNLAASDEEIAEASRRSRAMEFIEQLPEGFDTQVGERGVRLSGGECQRIALARMFLKDPPILILDEAVSAVDSEAEAHIQEVLRTLAADRTTIVIAHRLASLMLADRVILIEDGRVVEQGSHEQLLGADGPYTRLFQHQFQPQLRRSAVETTSSAA
jgi:ABC-type multidrug transport system fused ATPase/permease subunit